MNELWKLGILIHPGTKVCHVPNLGHCDLHFDVLNPGQCGRGSLLDHIYTKDCQILRCGVLSTYYSDHDPVYVEVEQ